jgi:hypothetical protein
VFFHAPNLAAVPMKNALLTLGLVLALVLPGAAYAQVVPGNGAVLPMASSTVGNATTFSKFMGGLTNIDRFAVTSASDGTLLASTGTKLSTGAQVTVASRASKAGVAGAIGRFAGKALPIGYTLGVGFALYDLATELGFGVSQSGSDIVLTQAPPGSCTVGPCWTFKTNFQALRTSSWTSASDMCYAVAAAQFPGQTITLHSSNVNTSNNTVACPITASSYGYYGGLSGFRVASAPVSASTPATVQDLENAIASKSGWPVSSALGRATVDAVKLGQESIELTPDTVTGPATTPGPTSTKTEPNGNVTTTTTTNNYNYAGDTVTVTTNTSTAVYNPTTQTTETTTETTEPELEPKDPCESDPNRIACAEFGTPEPEQIKDGGSGFTSIVPVSFSSSAGCPAPLAMAVMGHSYEISYAGTCNALDTYLKPLLLLLAAAAGVFIFTRSFSV